jgi:hypothetical protein
VKNTCLTITKELALQGEPRLARETATLPNDLLKIGSDRVGEPAEDDSARNRTLTLIEREDDTRSWRNFLIYFSHSTTMSCPPRGWRYILIGC